MLGTLKRAGDVLDLFTAEEPEWGVTAAAQRLGVGKSLAYDVLASLTAIGLLQRVGHGRYRLGWRTLSLATVLLRTSELKTLARPVMCDLAQRQGFTVSLLAWDRGRVICIDRRHGGQPSARGPLPGTAVALDGSAAAKVLLAGRSSLEVKELWENELLRTRHASLVALKADLERIRLHGWARDDATETVRSGTVAAPIRDADGDAAAALSLDPGAGSPADADLQTRMVVAAAGRISTALHDCVALRHREASTPAPAATA